MVRVVPFWTAEHQEPILLIYVVGRELHSEIVTIFKGFYWGKERGMEKLFENVFHQMLEICRMPCAHAQVSKGSQSCQCDCRFPLPRFLA